MPRTKKRIIKDPERYKTVLCSTFCANGECPYGYRCQFAHGAQELRCRPTQCLPCFDSSRSSPPPDTYHVAVPPSTPPPLPSSAPKGRRNKGRRHDASDSLMRSIEKLWSEECPSLYVTTTTLDAQSHPASALSAYCTNAPTQALCG